MWGLILFRKSYKHKITFSKKMTEFNLRENLNHLYFYLKANIVKQK